jgi:SAM-dependent methyltransferase
MGFTLDKIIPWGRTYDEYVKMFDLTEEDLGSRILGCGDGPAGFNSILTRRGGAVVSVDPIYVFDVEPIRSRITETYGTVMEQLLKNQGDYLWETIPSPEHLGDLRISAMETFLSDFDAGKKMGRYIAGELPSLPFESGQFDLALSSHLLFLYSAHLSVDFHLQALQEMLRVSREVRIFPLQNLDRSPSPHLPVVEKYFAEQGFVPKIKRVPYEFQRGGNEMLVIKRS